FRCVSPPMLLTSALLTGAVAVLLPHVRDADKPRRRRRAGGRLPNRANAGTCRDNELNDHGWEMTVAPDEAQALLRHAASQYLRANYSFGRRRAILAEGGFSPSVWSGFASDLAILGAAAPGADGGVANAMVVMEELG